MLSRALPRCRNIFGNFSVAQLASPLHDSVAMKLPKVFQMSSQKCRGKHLSYATEKRLPEVGAVVDQGAGEIPEAIGEQTPSRGGTRGSPQLAVGRAVGADANSSRSGGDSLHSGANALP